tara:strand:+ start:863 stop:1057 length:195 start_codon:yes stop_codon:yes gene_type:complete
MKNFVTTGEVVPVYDDKGKLDHYMVGRTYDGLTSNIRLNRVIPEYYVAGNHFYIDDHGNPWVKK